MTGSGRPHDHGPARRRLPRRAVLGGAAVGTVAVGAALLAVPMMGPGSRGGYLVPAPGGSEDLRGFERDLRAVREGGGGWVRFAVRAYDVVEEWDRGGAIAFDERALATVDRALDLARDAGLRVHLVTADSVPEDVLGPSGRTYLATMTEYWQVLAERLGERVEVWQVFNEADGMHFRTGQSLGNAPPTAYLKELASVMTRARRTIRAAAPRAEVTTTAGGYPVDDAMEQRWARFFGAVGPRLDVVAVDLYPQTDQARIDSLPERLGRLHRRVGRPVVVAELGLQTCAGCFSEAEQGVALSSALAALREAPARSVMLYELRDSDQDRFGVLHEDWSPKSGAKEISAALRRL